MRSFSASRLIITTVDAAVTVPEFGDCAGYGYHAHRWLTRDHIKTLAAARFKQHGADYSRSFRGMEWVSSPPDSVEPKDLARRCLGLGTLSRPASGGAVENAGAGVGCANGV
jgi:hypothetical protein